MAEAKVVITGDSSNAQNAMGQLEKSTNSFRAGMAKAGEAMTKAGKTMSLAVTGPIAALAAGVLGLTKKTGDYADSVLDLAAATGHSTDMIQEYQAIADRAGTNTDAVTNASQRLTAQMARGAEGSADLRLAVEELGLSFEEVQEASPDERMVMLMESLSGVEEAGERALLGTRLLRGSYEDLAPVLAMTDEEIENVINQARESGKIMDGEALNAANDFRMGLDELKLEFGGLFRTIATDLMPIMNDLLPLMRESIIPAIRNFAETVGGLIERFVELDPGVQKTIGLITGLAAAIGPTLIIVGKITAAIAALNPVVLGIVAAITAVTIAWSKWGEDIKEFSSEIVENVKQMAINIANWFIAIRDKNIERMQTLIDNIKEFFTWENIKNNFKEAQEGIIAIFTGIRDTVSGVFSGIVETIKTAINGLIKMINGAIENINGMIETANRVPGVNIPTIKQIPALAEGGNIIRQGLTMVGEEGPEILNLPRGATVTPLNQTTNRSSININITGNKIDSGMDINRIGSQLVSKLRRAGVVT